MTLKGCKLNESEKIRKQAKEEQVAPHESKTDRKPQTAIDAKQERKADGKKAD
jgi:hypothetical protein